MRTLLKPNEKVSIYAISVDAPNVSKEFARKIASDRKGDVGFPLLSDPDHKVIDAYRLRDPAYDGTDNFGIPHPAVYVIDRTGKVSWAKIEADYRQRPDTAEIRKALEILR